MTNLTADQIAEMCRTYWLGSGVAAQAADEMTAELRTHLQDATSAGKTVDAVTGPDIEAFAEEWAAASRGPKPAPPPRTSSLPRTDSRQPTWGLWLGLASIVLVVVAVALLGPTDDAMDQGQWTAIWLIAAAVLAIGEMVTAGFFLLPFAAGAAVSGILAMLSISVAAQIVVFVGISVLSLWLIQRFARKDIHGELLPVGAARYVGTSAIVTEPVTRLQSGRVQMGSEDWRAITDGDDEIPAGVEVRVTEVRGARLVVEQVN